MTTNDATAREAITEQLDSVLALHKFGEDIVPMAVTERQAEAVIAHLWSRADDPAVVDDFCTVLLDEYNRNQGITDASFYTLQGALRLLIGPRPEEQEAE